MNDPAQGLRFLGEPRPLCIHAELLDTRQRRLLWTLVAAMHLLGVLGVRELMDPEPLGSGRVLEVQLVQRMAESVLPLPAWPSAPKRTSRTHAVAEPPPNADANSVAAVAALTSDSSFLADPRVRLFDSQGAVLLGDPAPVAQAWSDRDRLLRSRTTELPGHTDAAAAEKVAIRLRRANTPADVVGAVLRFLFGTVAVDDCAAIEGRLHVSDPGVTREIDLVKFRKTCLR